MLKTLLVSLVVISCAANAARYMSLSQAPARESLGLACELARAEALYPARVEIFRQCMLARDDEIYCDLKAAAYNGYKANGAPQHYDLPACRDSFAARSSAFRFD